MGILCFGEGFVGISWEGLKEAHILRTVSSPSGWVLAAFAGSLQGPELLGLRLYGSSGERWGSSFLPPPVCRALAPVDLSSWEPAALELQQEGCTAHFSCPGRERSRLVMT